MLTVLITRGQIIIPAGYFPARCLCHEEATPPGACGQVGSSALPTAPAEREGGQRKAVRVQRVCWRLHPAVETKGSCGPH